LCASLWPEPERLRRNHLRVYRELEASGLPVALVAAVEPDATRGAETAAKYSIPVFASVEELLRQICA